MRRHLRWIPRLACPAGAVDSLAHDDPASAPVAGRWRRAAAFTVAVAVVALGAFGASRLTRSPAAPSSPAQPRIELRLARELPWVDLGWVRMRDHFMVTVGAGAGSGAALGDLLVLADATFAPRSSFPLHRHAGVEIVSLVLDGTLTHQEPGRAIDIPAGGAQAIIAGAGIVHAEANRTDRPVRMLQLWFAARDPGAAPTYDLLPTPSASVTGLSPVPLAGVRSDVQIRRGTLAPGQSETWTIAPGRIAYALCVGGGLDLDDVALADGDAAVLTAGRVVATARDAAQVVLIELAAPPTL